MLEIEIQKLTSAVAELTKLMQTGAVLPSSAKLPEELSVVSTGTDKPTTKVTEIQEEKIPEEPSAPKKDKKVAKKSEITEAQLQKVIAAMYDGTDEATVSFIDSQIDEIFKKFNAEVLSDISAENKEEFQNELMRVAELKSVFVKKKELAGVALDFIAKTHKDAAERAATFKSVLSSYDIAKLSELPLEKVEDFSAKMQEAMAPYSQKAEEEEDLI